MIFLPHLYGRKITKLQEAQRLLTNGSKQKIKLCKNIDVL